MLDIASKNIYLGAPKIVTGLMTSLYLGFGLTLGSDIWLHFDTYGRSMVESTADKMAYVNGTLFSLNASTPAWLSPANLTGTWTLDEQPASATMNIVNGCYRDPNWVWPLRPLPWYSLFVLLPVLNLILSMRRNQPLKTARMPVMIAISCVFYVVTAPRLGLLFQRGAHRQVRVGDVQLLAARERIPVAQGFRLAHIPVSQLLESHGMSPRYAGMALWQRCEPGRLHANGHGLPACLDAQRGGGGEDG